MKSFLIIGMGKFGHHICHNLADLGNELMVVDIRADKVEDVAGIVTSAKIGDCTKKEVLGTFGINNFDVCLVCIGENFQNSLEVTYNLSELGARRIVSLASTDIHAKFLLRNGASDVIYPERDIAQRISVTLSKESVFDYVALAKDYSIYEAKALEEWKGKTIRQINVRFKYGVSILGIKDPEGSFCMPEGNYIFNEVDHLLVMGKPDDLNKIVR